ncbi:Zinc/iron permease [Baffinella frigidus]|nr:Zinc/iron permease [Cryptophyta sp. CCMP2293]
MAPIGVGWKVAALSAITAASVVGVCAGWMVQRKGSSEGRVYFFIRGVTAGMLLSIAFVHIIPEAMQIMAGLCDYPVAGLFVVAGMLLILLSERISMEILWYQQRNALQTSVVVCCHSQAHEHGHACLRHAHVNKQDDHQSTERCTHSGDHAGCGDHADARPDSLNISLAGDGAPMLESAVGARFKAEEDLEAGETDQLLPHAHAHAHSHSHGGGGGVECPPSHAQQAKHGHLESCLAAGEAREVVTLSMIELSLVIHSFVLGVDLGLNTRPGAMVGLVFALVFHQLFEGLGLGACMAAVRQHLSRSKVMFMVLVFSLTFPLAGFAGIAYQYFSDLPETSASRRWVQGTLDALSGGVLIYLATIHFIAEDFSRTDVNVGSNWPLRWTLIAGLVIGAGAMALLALWA